LGGHPGDSVCIDIHEQAEDDVEILSLQLLRGFRLERRGAPIALPLNGQRLVSFLALAEADVPRLYLAATLWLDVPEERSSANLRSSLWRVGQLAEGLLVSTKSHVGLGPTVRVDLRRTLTLARRLINEVDQRDLPAGAVGDLSGELLPGWYDDWILMERERLRQLSLHAMESLCARMTLAGRYGEAIEAGLEAVRGEPLRESAHRVLIMVHIAEGNHCEALRQYESYCRLLRTELGMAPSPSLTELMNPLQSDDAAVTLPRNGALHAARGATYRRPDHPSLAGR
jgi:DNA-binding SARP family transcriptional activator